MSEKKRSERDVEDEITAYIRKVDKDKPHALRRTILYKEVRRIQNEKYALKEEIEKIEKERYERKGQL